MEILQTYDEDVMERKHESCISSIYNTAIPIYNKSPKRLLFTHILAFHKPVYFHITMNTKCILDICLFVGIKLNIYLAVKNKLHIFNAVYTIVTDIANLS